MPLVLPLRSMMSGTLDTSHSMRRRAGSQPNIIASSPSGIIVLSCGIMVDTSGAGLQLHSDTVGPLSANIMGTGDWMARRGFVLGVRSSILRRPTTAKPGCGPLIGCPVSSRPATQLCGRCAIIADRNVSVASSWARRQRGGFRIVAANKITAIPHLLKMRRTESDRTRSRGLCSGLRAPVCMLPSQERSTCQNLGE